MSKKSKKGKEKVEALDDQDDEEEPQLEDAKSIGELIRHSGKGRGQRQNYEAFDYDGSVQRCLCDCNDAAERDEMKKTMLVRKCDGASAIAAAPVSLEFTLGFANRGFGESREKFSTISNLKLIYSPQIRASF